MYVILGKEKHTLTSTLLYVSIFKNQQTKRRNIINTTNIYLSLSETHNTLALTINFKKRLFNRITWSRLKFSSQNY